MILRKWDSRIRTSDEAVYVAYIEATGSADYTETPDNLCHQILVRRNGDGSGRISRP